MKHNDLLYLSHNFKDLKKNYYYSMLQTLGANKTCIQSF